MPHSLKRIGVLTGGGDCPGLNAVIRAVTKTAIWKHGLEVVGIEDGFQGLIEDRVRPLTSRDASGILTRGGTILGLEQPRQPAPLLRARRPRDRPGVGRRHPAVRRHRAPP